MMPQSLPPILMCITECADSDTPLSRLWVELYLTVLLCWFPYSSCLTAAPYIASHNLRVSQKNGCGCLNRKRLMIFSFDDIILCEYWKCVWWSKTLSIVSKWVGQEMLCPTPLPTTALLLLNVSPLLLSKFVPSTYVHCDIWPVT